MFQRNTKGNSPASHPRFTTPTITSATIFPPPITFFHESPPSFIYRSLSTTTFPSLTITTILPLHLSTKSPPAMNYRSELPSVPPHSTNCSPHSYLFPVSHQCDCPLTFLKTLFSQTPCSGRRNLGNSYPK